MGKEIMEKLKILYVDDEQISLKNFKMTFKKDYDIVTASSAEKGFEVLKQEQDIALVIADQRMPKMTGVDFLAKVMRKYPDTVRMVLSAYTDSEDMIAAINKGQVFRYITKPWSEDVIRDTLALASETYELTKKNKELLSDFQRRNSELEQLNSQLEERTNSHSRAVAELKVSEQRCRSEVEHATDAIISTSVGGKIISWNLGAEKMFNFTAGEALGKQFTLIFPKGEKRTLSRILKDLGGKGKGAAENQTVSLNAQRKDGTEMPVEMSRTSWKTKEGRFYTAVIRDISTHKQTEESMRKRESELEIHVRNLQEINSALNVLLVRKEEDKRELEERILSSIKKLAQPYLVKLRATELTSTQEAYVTILETNLNEIMSPTSVRVSSKYLDLTPKEIQVANLIKDGKSNRDISKIMLVSLNTILFHRHNLRKKLGLLKQKTNLRSYLTSVPT